MNNTDLNNSLNNDLDIGSVNNVKATTQHIIDPHLHLFDLVQGDYHWLQPQNPPYWPDKAIIHRDFTEADLALTPPLALKGFVHIEAGFDNAQPWREIAWLEKVLLENKCLLAFKSVACIDVTLKESEFIEQVKQLKNYHSVVGVRHILDEDAVAILSQPSVQHNLAYLAQQHYSFDVQMPLSDKLAVSCLITILENIPKLTVIINHAGWPPYFDVQANKVAQQRDNNSEWLLWLSGISQLSQFERCAIKCSGWEMINREFSRQWQQVIILECLKAFGEHRVMLASNFPLVLFNQSYQELWQSVSLDTPEIKAALTYQNAAHWYRF